MAICAMVVLDDHKMNWLEGLKESDAFVAMINSERWFRDAKCQLQYEEALAMKKIIIFIVRARVEIPEKYKMNLLYRFNGSEDLKAICDDLGEKLANEEIENYPFITGSH